MIEYWIDIPNLITVNLPLSFWEVHSKSITSICMNMNEWIDVSPILANLLPATYSFDYIESIDSNVTSIHLPNRTCNDSSDTTFNFSRFTLLEELIIGSDSFSNVNIFKIDGLNHLKSIKIGRSSFTHLRNIGYWNSDKADNPNRSFSILNCIALESIEIGESSFSDYYSGFELFNLPKLSTIKIGEIGNASWNFFYSSFVIKGRICGIVMNRSSKFEFDWIRWWCIPLLRINRDIKYLNDLNEWIIDLPHLNSIKLGYGALTGRDDDPSCSLKMESDIDMNELIFRSS